MLGVVERRAFGAPAELWLITLLLSKDFVLRVITIIVRLRVILLLALAIVVIIVVVIVIAFAVRGSAANVKHLLLFLFRPRG